MATLDADDLAAIAALLLSGGVRLADGVAHGGTPGSSTATFAMQAVNVTNPTGDAWTAVGVGGSGMYLSGTNYGLFAFGDGDFGIPIKLQSSSSQGLVIQSPGSAIDLSNSGPFPTIQVTAASVGQSAIALSAGGSGLSITTGSGHAILLAPTDGDGIHIAPTLSVNAAATGISVIGAGTGDAVKLGDGTNGAEGLRIVSGPDGTALSVEGAATGMLITGRGALVVTGSDGAGVQVGGTDGPGILVQSNLVAAPSMPAVALIGAGAAAGLDCASGDSTFADINLSGSGKLDFRFIAATLAQFFTMNSGTTYASAVDGSVVKETATHDGGSDPDVILSGVLGDQSLGDADYIVLPSGPGDNGALVGCRLRITSGLARYQERTIIGWFGTDKRAALDQNFVVGVPAPGDSFQVRYDHSYQLDEAGNVICIAGVVNFFAAALAQLFTLDTTKVYADAADGSVVKEITANAGGGTPPSAAAIATAIFTDLLASSDFNTAASFGKLVKDNLDAAVSTRLPTTSYTAPPSTAAIATAVQTDVSDTLGASIVQIAADTVTLKTRVPSALTITGGKVDVNDKTGYKLASDGLDSIDQTPPTGPATTFPQKVNQIWRRFFKKTTKSATGSPKTIKTFADDGTTVVTTQVYTDDGAGNETSGAAT